LAGIGAMIEEPAFYPYLSGFDNLRVVARHASVSESNIHRVLDQVELTSRMKDRFGTYSMGMKQRLGLAAALLKDPRLLILDEPTNGLDPQGIADMRVLLRSLVDEDRTVLLSSHLMTDVEQICDRIGVVRKGRIVAEGTLDELRGHHEIRIRATPLVQAAEIVAGLSFGKKVRTEDGALFLESEKASACEVNRVLVEAGVRVHELTPIQASLEKVFLDIAAQEGDK
jgi:ABC-2 type transport system ATP-binding protein